MFQKPISFLLLSAVSLALGLSLRADVEVFKSIKGDLTQVEAGEPFTYQLQYRAASTTTDFFNTTLTDVLPEGLEFISFVGTVHVDSYDFDESSRTLTVQFVDPLPAGSTGELELKTRFTPGETLDGAVAVNKATIDADNSPADTSSPVLIKATASNQASLEKTLLGSSIPLDQDVTYRVRLNNQDTTGGLDLSGVSMVDELPAGVVFVDASGSGVYSAIDSTVTWTLGDVDAGKTISRTVTVRYPATEFAVDDDVENRVSARVTPLGGAEESLEDSVIHTIELPKSNLFFSKSVNSRFVYEGKDASKTWNFKLENKGNVPENSVVVTDMIPDHIELDKIRVPRLSGTPSDLQDQVSVFYQTNLNASWTGFPDNPYDGVSSQWVGVGELGLAPNEYVTGVRWEFGTIPVGYSTSDFSIRGTVMSTNRSGVPLAVGFDAVNSATVEYEDFEGPKSSSSDASIPVKSVRPVVKLTKSSSPSTVNDGGSTTYTLALENRTEAAEALQSPVIADLLDDKLVYVPGSWSVVEKPAGAPDPVFEEIPNYNGSGRTLLRWSWTGAADYDLPINEKIRIAFDVEIPRGTIFGNIQNRVTLIDWGNSEIDTYNGVGSTPDSDDLDGDGDTAEKILFRGQNTNVRGRASMESVKWVKGQLDNGWSKYPNSGFTVPGGQADYRLIVENTGNVPIRDAEILDILPVVGDTGVIDLNARDTQWIAALAGPVVAPPGVTVYYSRTENPERPKYVDGVVGPIPAEWSATPPATLVEARSLLFVFNGVTIQPGESFELTWPMRAPVGTPTDGPIAWNSFGYLGTRVDNNSQLLASEPIKVGISVEPDNNASYGDRVWLDVNRDGIQDAGEIGLNGIRVSLYEDNGVGLIGDGVRDPSVDRFVGFTITSDDYEGNPGYYLFPDLDRGNYYAVFDIPDGYGVSPSHEGGDDAVDSDVDEATGFTPITDLAAAEVDRTWDLGLWLPPSSVSIVKVAGDAADGDDLWVLPGTPVTYSYTVTNTGEMPLVRLRVTDDVLGLVDIIDGPLEPGDSVTVTKTSGALSDGVVNIGKVVGHPADPSGNEIPGAPAVESDDPATVSVLASIGDYVWYDINLNGVQDSGESPVPGTKVTLYDAAGDPIATKTTNANGRYLFTGLMPGDYSLGFDPPADYVISGKDLGGNDAKDSDVDQETGRTVVTTLVASEQDRSWDAGLWKPSSLGDYVWIDLDADGIQDGSESGIGGITVNLLDGSGNPVLVGGNPVTTTTAGDGSYEFEGLIPGTYGVQFVLPTDYIFSPQDADANGINGTDNSDADETTGLTATVVLGNGEHNPRLDAGLIPANPEIALTKSVTPTEYSVDGEVLTYAFIVENTGNVPLIDVTVSDPLLTVSGGPINLAVGEIDSTTFTGSYAVGLGDLNAGSRPNTASVSAKDPRTDEVVTDTSSAVATALQLPSITVTKTGTYVSTAGDCNPLGLAGEFNALIFGDLNASGGDTDGRLAVGGNGTFSAGYSVGFPIKGYPIPTYYGGTEDMFIVAGNLSDGNFGVNGNVVHGGVRTGPVRVMINGNLTRQVVPVTFDGDGNVPGNGGGISFADLRDEMEVRSALLGAFEERGVVDVSETTGGSGVVGLSLVGDDPELNIFHIPADQISLSSAAIDITVPDGSTVLVNVYGDAVSIHNVGMTLHGADVRDVLFNLVDATSVSTSGFAWLGSVLATYADGEFVGGSIDGIAIFGGNVITSGGFEFHNFPFNGGICTEIVYEFTVANTGNVTVTDIQIDDPVVDVEGGPISLDPGESDSTTFTARYRLKASDVINGSFTNTATASGLPPFGARVTASDSDTQTFTIPGIGSGGTAGSGGAPSAGSGGTPGTPTDTASNGEKPDLQVNSVTLTPKPSAVGDTFTAVVEVENLGLWKAEGAVLRFWSNESGWVSVGEPGEAEVHLGTMEVDEVRTVTVDGFTTPNAAGTYHLRAFVDAEGTVEEQSEGNNQLTGTYTIFDEASTNPPAWMKPDFVVQSVELDPSPTVTSAEFDVVVRILNQGHIAGNAGTVEFWASAPSYGDLSASPDETTSAGSINPGEVVELTFPGLRAPDDQGTYHVRVVVDADDQTDEYSTGNNQGGATYTVFPLRAEIEVHPEGMQISWNSAVGYTYYVERSTSLTGGFTDISGPINATPSENVFVDDEVPAGGVVFYRVWGER
ncbi:SdrD B-like domain-containing protein [Puniceicoccus vermicola]|uniref:Choice-of-anchor A family protein n=1 Tax=Puniceicoccus vermicola TaxID=388746 RepID=A0A7X1AXS0_9BACT|nr:SdrD B-like domain-containing protein [Puniceicoccus vermicola]MBC2601961.1 choice-of-anchor A family protein [Puniceicoccus vermicola]